MKRILTISLIILAVGILVILLVPLAFKAKIVAYVKDQANQQLNARIEFTDYHLTLIRSFPHLTLTLDDLSLTGIESFENDTLFMTESLFVTFNLKSLFADRYEMRNIRLDKPRFFLKVTDSGSANWDIIKPSEAPPDETAANLADTVADSFALSLRKVSINDALVIYQDEEQNVDVRAAHLQLSLSGDLTTSQARLTTMGSIGELSVDYEGLPVLQKVAMKLASEIMVELDDQKYTFQDTELSLNDVQLLVEGYWAMPGDTMQMDIGLSTGNNDFKQLLSLIPLIYQKEFEQVVAEGIFRIDGFVKGIYTEERLPSFEIRIQVDNGMFMYPELPSAVSDITVRAGISNPGGDADQTSINMESLHLLIAGNPLDASLFVSNPVSDPDLRFTAKGRVDLGTIRQVYPLESGQVFSGLLETDLSVKGRLSDFEKQNYAGIEARGTFQANDIELSGDPAMESLAVHSLLLEIHPDRMDLKSLSLNYITNDLQATGTVTNYIPYLLKKELLTGTLRTSSRFIHLDSLMTGWSGGEPAETGVAVQDKTAFIIEIPENLEFTLHSIVDRLIYQKLDMKNAEGMVLIHDGELEIRDLRMDALGGVISFYGKFLTRGPDLADAEVNLRLTGLDVQQSYNSFALMHSFVPVAERTRGDFSANLSLKTRLNEQMRPLLGSISGFGSLSASKIVIEDIQVFNKIAEVLKLEAFKNATIDGVNLNFELLEGKAHVSPFSFRIGSVESVLGGYTALDQTINYILNLKVPRSAFGDQFNSVMDKLSGQINKQGVDFQPVDKVDVDVLIEGTISQPKVTIGLKEVLEKTVEDLKAKVEEELMEKKEELEARAREEAQQYLARIDSTASQLVLEAETKSDEIQSLARQSAQKLRTEADSAAVKLISEGKKKGPLAEIAAKTAAAEMKKEADNKADKLIREADLQAENLISQAQSRAKAMREEARLKYPMVD